MLKMVVVLPLQVNEVLREPFQSRARFIRKLMSRRVIDRSRGCRDFVGAAQKRPHVAEECLRLLGCLRRRDGMGRFGRRVIVHRDSKGRPVC